jgi:NAD(P)-dependent dehydrogenase (short-subunit alcohol dehydrogenase family)
MANGLVVLVTGSSSGFGRLMVETLARRGHVTFAGMRDPDGRNASAAGELRALADSQKLPLHVVALDVTSDASTEAAAAAAIAKAGRIDALVNNAGIASFGATEAFTLEQVAEQFNTNVFGSLRTRRAVLPHMRAAGSGLLIEISTSLGRVPMPFMAIYCACKAAEEMFAEEGRYTLAPLGIESTILEASVYPTPMLQRMIQPADPSRLPGYGPLFPVMEQLGKAMEYMLSMKPNPQEVADAVAALVEAPRGSRPMRTLVGGAHPEGVRDMNRASDQTIAGFYSMMGVGHLGRLPA